MKKIMFLAALTLGITAFAQTGINTSSPTKTLDVNGEARVRTLPLGNTTGKKFVVADGDGNLGRANVPTPEIIIVQYTGALGTFNLGGAGSIVNLPSTVLINTIEGVTFDPASFVISLPPGTYQFILSYEGVATGATGGGVLVSSYFFDFPATPGFTRVHGNAGHNGTSSSNHGVQITHTAVLTAPTVIRLHLGRGGGGTFTGVVTVTPATQLTIQRIQ